MDFFNFIKNQMKSKTNAIKETQKHKNKTKSTKKNIKIIKKDFFIKNNKLKCKI